MSASIPSATRRPSDHEALSQRVAEAVFHLFNNPADLISQSISTVSGLADLLASHGDMAAFHGHSVEPEHIRSAASAIHRECRLIGALAEHLAEEARTLRRLIAEEVQP